MWIKTMNEGIVNSNMVKIFGIEPIDEYKPKDGFCISALMTIGSGDNPVPIKNFSSKNKAKEYLNKLNRRLNAEISIQLTKVGNDVLDILQKAGKL